MLFRKHCVWNQCTGKIEIWRTMNWDNTSISLLIGGLPERAPKGVKLQCLCGEGTLGLVQIIGKTEALRN